MPLLIVV